MKMATSLDMDIHMNMYTHILTNIPMSIAMNTDMKTITLMFIPMIMNMVTHMNTQRAAIVVVLVKKLDIVIAMKVDIVIVTDQLRRRLIRMKRYCSTCWIITHIMQLNWIRWQPSWQQMVMVRRQSRFAKQ